MMTSPNHEPPREPEKDPWVYSPRTDAEPNLPAFVVVGAIVGAISTPIVSCLLDLIVRSPNLRDGQYPIGCLCNMPIGAVLGAYLGGAFCQSERGSSRKAAALCITAGALAVLLSGIQYPFFEPLRVPIAAGFHALGALLILGGAAWLARSSQP